MKIISVFTSSRAEYHLLYRVIKRINEDKELKLDLIVSGTHLSHEYGYTINQIEQDGFPIGIRIETLYKNSSIDKIIAKTMVECGKHFKKIHSDFLIVLGDRYEILGPVIAASNALIPIAHIHGGETTEGAIDEAIRHAVTKFSYLHFPSCEAYRKRIIQLGEDPSRVFNSGSLGVENILKQKLISKKELEKSLNFELNRFCVVTFHPVTLERKTCISQINELLQALTKFNYKYIITKANADSGGSEINNFIQKFISNHGDNFILVDSLGMIRYLSALKYCEMVIGNSSSGLLEAPSFSIPTINIGDRQKGRISAKSVINCNPDEHSICDAIQLASSAAFRDGIKDMPQIYGNGQTSSIIIKEIKKALDKGVVLKKHFFDIDIKEQ